jgi:hypothetical protein
MANISSESRRERTGTERGLSRVSRCRATASAGGLGGGVWLAAMLLLALRPAHAALPVSLPVMPVALLSSWAANGADSAVDSRARVLLWCLHLQSQQHTQNTAQQNLAFLAAPAPFTQLEQLAPSRGVSLDSAFRSSLNRQIALDAPAVSPLSSLSIVPRLDATQHLAAQSLTAHEAAFLSGARANRNLE